MEWGGKKNTMSSPDTNEPIMMEQDEYLEYLKNQIKDIPSENKTPIAQISMYQMNKDIIRTMKKFNNMAVNNALEKVKEWYLNYLSENPKARFFVLLNHEQHYYTMFTRDWKIKVKSIDQEANNFIAAVKDILTNYYGDNDIRAIDVDSNGAVEIWGMWDGEPSVAYLFPYDQGVVLY